jgi:hypothetical protein
MSASDYNYQTPSHDAAANALNGFRLVALETGNHHQS